MVSITISLSSRLHFHLYDTTFFHSFTSKAASLYSLETLLSITLDKTALESFMASTMKNASGREKVGSAILTLAEGSQQTPPRTPTTVTSAAHVLLEEMRHIHNTLSGLPSLAPGAEVNALLTRLVSLCILPYDQGFITEFFDIEDTRTMLSQLRALCAVAEGELEAFWARKIFSESFTTKGT